MLVALHVKSGVIEKVLAHKPFEVVLPSGVHFVDELRNTPLLIIEVTDDQWAVYEQARKCLADQINTLRRAADTEVL